MSNVSVTTHVGRDLLQSANIFKTADIAVWEYVVNSIQYINPGVPPIVNITINNKKKIILIEDNGRGMDLDGLNNFFRMHGENIDRESGHIGRGKFGTGKSAAFGIANKLIVSSVHNNKRNTISLSREQILESDGGAIPVEILEKDIYVENIINGTTIRIEDVILSKIDATKIIKKVEKHLQSFRHLKPRVLVGDHMCTYKEPGFNQTFTFTPDETLVPILGNTQLVIKVAQSPLAQDERGISVSAGKGNLIAIEDAGVCTKEMGEYLYGDIDVPELDNNKYEMDAYDSSRDMKLRPEHPVSMALNIFIGTHLEETRKSLVKQRKEVQKSEDQKRLKEQADKIAELLNKDFKEFNDKILEIKSSTSSLGRYSSKPSPEDAENREEDGWVSGLDERGFIDENEIPDLETSNPNPSDKIPKPIIPRIGRKEDSGNASLDPLSSNTSRKSKRPKGGFSVEYEHMGTDADRAVYTADKGVFTVNLDHPVVKSAEKNLGINDIAFQRLSHEIIFAEYALALANMSAVDDPDIPADDVIYDARETLNRISSKSALLYEKL
ncbi:MAG TPA: ATP-binding protein [Candidatus Dojkabacteria bacterium]